MPLTQLVPNACQLFSIIVGKQCHNTCVLWHGQISLIIFTDCFLRQHLILINWCVLWFDDITTIILAYHLLPSTPPACDLLFVSTSSYYLNVFIYCLLQSTPCIVVIFRCLHFISSKWIHPWSILQSWMLLLALSQIVLRCLYTTEHPSSWQTPA